MAGIGVDSLNQKNTVPFFSNIIVPFLFPAIVWGLMMIEKRYQTQSEGYNVPLIRTEAHSWVHIAFHLVLVIVMGKIVVSF